jgi:hypothetical protein
MTVTEKDLFLAILAMDSYNRGYDAGLMDNGENDPDGLGDSPGTAVGGATILDVDLPQGAQAAGFYAVAYQTQYGTVISYRGTDFTHVISSKGNTRFAQASQPIRPLSGGWLPAFHCGPS